MSSLFFLNRKCFLFHRYEFGKDMPGEDKSRAMVDVVTQITP